MWWSNLCIPRENRVGIDVIITVVWTLEELLDGVGHVAMEGDQEAVFGLVESRLGAEGEEAVCDAHVWWAALGPFRAWDGDVG